MINNYTKLWLVNILWHEPLLFPKQCSEQYDLSSLLVKCVAVLGLFHLVVSEGDAMDCSRWRKQIGMIDDHDKCEWVNVSSGTGSPGLSQTESIEL